jgi:hypothetical protein
MPHLDEVERVLPTGNVQTPHLDEVETALPNGNGQTMHHLDEVEGVFRIEDQTMSSSDESERVLLTEDVQTMPPIDDAERVFPTEDQTLPHLDEVERMFSIEDQTMLSLNDVERVPPTGDIRTIPHLAEVERLLLTADVHTMIRNEEVEDVEMQNNPEELRRQMWRDDEARAERYLRAEDNELMQMSNSQIDRLMEIHPYLKHRISQQLAESSRRSQAERDEEIETLISHMEANFRDDLRFYQRALAQVMGEDWPVAASPPPPPPPSAN